MRAASQPVTIDPVASVRWKLTDFLEQENLTAYKLAMVVDRKRENTIYRLARKGETLKRVDLDVLAEIINSLRELTGKPVTFDDLLEFDPSDN